MSELISVIIPMYNVEEYLEECLNSVLQQSYKEIEVIVINDGSTDASYHILDKYSRKYNKIKVINQENLGQSVARNQGIEYATGKYLYFLDADDYIAKDTFSKLINLMNTNNIDLVRFSAEPFVDGINMKLNINQYNFSDVFESGYPYEKSMFLRLTTKAYTASPVLYLFKRELLERGKLRFKPGIVHEDDLFSTELFLSTNKAMYDSTPFYKRRYRPESTMTSVSLTRRKDSFESRCIILKELYILLQTYKNKEEIKLVKSRITTIIRILSVSYPDLPNTYKLQQVVKVKIPTVTIRYFLYKCFKYVTSIFKRNNK